MNVMGIVVGSSEKQFILDDSTGQIQVRNESGQHCIAGDVVMVMGTVNGSDGTSLIGNIVKKISPAWMKVRKCELKKQDPLIVSDLSRETPQAVQKDRAEALDYILSLVRKLDEGRGVPMEEIVQKSMIKEGQQIIENLMSRGDIFEVEPGKIKVLE